MTDTQRQQADRLRATAKQALKRLLKIPEDMESEDVDHLVNCLIASALLEVASIYQKDKNLFTF